jgi:hypothetical protein
VLRSQGPQHVGFDQVVERQQGGVLLAGRINGWKWTVYLSAEEACVSALPQVSLPTGLFRPRSLVFRACASVA